MTTISINMPRFDIVEYIRKLRNVSFTQEQAETIAQETEHIIESVLEQTKHVVENKGLATKNDVYEIKQQIKELELVIEKIRFDSLKFIIWTGVAVVITLSGTMFTLLKIMLH